MVTIRANNPVLRNRRIKRQAEPKNEYNFEYEHTPMYDSLMECAKIWTDVLTSALIEAGKGLQKWLEEHPEYGRY